jgi:hypothetical protein
MDSYAGTYDLVLTEFVVAGENWNASELYLATLPTMANAYIGLFVDPNNPYGSTGLIHAPRFFPTSMGHPSPFDYEVYALLDDVSGSMVQVVEYSKNLFESTPEVYTPLTENMAWEMWRDEQDLLPSLKNRGEKQVIRVPKTIYLPP